MKGKLYLIPNIIGIDTVDLTIPKQVQEITLGLPYYIVENLRTTRRYLKLLDQSVDIDQKKFKLIDKHQSFKATEYLQPIINGVDGGLISEAGLPAIADPGNTIVEAAHKNNIKVIPLTGPSSILLALMASGLNGQHFSFEGYLPREDGARKAVIQKLEKESHKTGKAVIFIETPYRNIPMYSALTKFLQSDTRLCIAHSITTADEWIKTQSIWQWRKLKEPDFHKKPAIFIFQA